MIFTVKGYRRENYNWDGTSFLEVWLEIYFKPDCEGRQLCGLHLESGR